VTAGGDRGPNLGEAEDGEAMEIKRSAKWRIFLNDKVKVELI
jgi:hypothetical protein